MISLLLKYARTRERAPTIIIITRVQFKTSLSLASFLNIARYKSFANIEPAPSKSESVLDIVAEIIPANNNSVGANACRAFRRANANLYGRTLGALSLKKNSIENLKKRVSNIDFSYQ